MKGDMGMNNLNTIFFLLALTLTLFITLILHNKESFLEKEFKRTRLLAFDAIFLSLILIMTFVPNLGYITLFGGVITFTLLHLPVIIGAALFGWKRGAIYGAFFGVGSFIKAVSLATSPFDLLFVNPLISILPRVIFGFGAGLLFSLLKGKSKKPLLALVAFASSIFHTAVVFASIYLFAKGHAAWLWDYIFGSGKSSIGLAFVVITIIGSGGEAILASLLTPSIYLVLEKAMPSIFYKREKAR